MTKRPITKRQLAILAYLRQKNGIVAYPWRTPTEIGLHLGFSYTTATTKACTSLRRLLELGYVRRKEFYPQYQLTPRGEVLLGPEKAIIDGSANA
jgi:DNA-binding MarR family transcriptional regulator